MHQHPRVRTFLLQLCVFVNKYVNPVLMMPKPSCPSGWQRSLTYCSRKLPSVCWTPPQIPRSICSKACARAGLPFMANSLFPEQIPFSFSRLHISLRSFLYLRCCLEFAFKIILSVNVCTMFEKPEVPQFIMISFVFFPILFPSPDRRHTNIPLYPLVLNLNNWSLFSVPVCLTPVLLDVQRGTGQSYNQCHDYSIK